MEKAKCLHENQLEITSLGDRHRRFACPDCGKFDEAPKKLEELEELSVWVLQQEDVVAGWKLKRLLR